MAEVDIQRQNYIAAIRSSISDVDLELRNRKSDIQQIEDLIEYCKANKLRKFKRVVKFELKLANKKAKWLEDYKKDLVKLLSKAERYAPGKGWR